MPTLSFFKERIERGVLQAPEAGAAAKHARLILLCGRERPVLVFSVLGTRSHRGCTLYLDAPARWSRRVSEEKIVRAKRVIDVVGLGVIFVPAAGCW